MDIDAPKQTYIDMFGEVPPLPAAKFGFMADIDVDALERIEALGAGAFLSPMFDQKSTQLLVVAVLIAEGVLVISLLPMKRPASTALRTK